jgi:hypothetical protein
MNASFLDTLRSKYEVRVEGAAAGLFAAPAASGAAQ